MKQKLQLFILTMLCSVSHLQAQKTDVWDFGALGQPAIVTTPF